MGERRQVCRSCSRYSSSFARFERRDEDVRRGLVGLMRLLRAEPRRRVMGEGAQLRRSENPSFGVHWDDGWRMLRWCLTADWLQSLRLHYRHLKPRPEFAP